LKRKYVWILSAITVALLLLLLNFPKYRTEPVSEPASSNIPFNSTAITQSSQESSEIITMVSKTDVYTLKEYEGRIGIFHNDDTEPYQLIDVDVSTFSEEDQRLLKEGIKVFSVEELNQKIEDYES
jgi:1-aminocyclopropane-1-carboxylate deaminase/D-cysteine desulfhydrase-like pyridoxal-dependent ACC family enzyme